MGASTGPAAGSAGPQCGDAVDAVTDPSGSGVAPGAESVVTALGRAVQGPVGQISQSALEISDQQHRSTIATASPGLVGSGKGEVVLQAETDLWTRQSTADLVDPQVAPGDKCLRTVDPHQACRQTAISCSSKEALNSGRSGVQGRGVGARI